MGRYPEGKVGCTLIPEVFPGGQGDDKGGKAGMPRKVASKAAETVSAYTGSSPRLSPFLSLR